MSCFYSGNSQLVDQNLWAGNGNHQTHNNNVNARDVNYNLPVRMDIQFLPRRILGNNIGPLHGVLFGKNQQVLRGRPVEAGSLTNQEVFLGVPVGIGFPAMQSRPRKNHN